MSFLTPGILIRFDPHKGHCLNEGKISMKCVNSERAVMIRKTVEKHV